ncbi:hypothetical protein P691DRAFT_809166 [Macrolepiota fuliginosa MF-IS2]|uniref:Up-regulated during septation protein 1 domain-containing protein n=1 Tax=Macrolepiota fuliginosa MF-IS2 TaxID=1400762 RepID=A0A9P6C3Q8_9AGAR|nr:hypothetical protein P691DRAFT_809166 [Macrolepiota fuliginosa MF-IS2]
MNGVRRLLGAATGTSPPSPDKDSPLSQSSPTVPLAFVKNNPTPNWPPGSPSTSTKQLPLGETFQSTAALFLGKKEKSRQPPPPEEEVTIGSPYSATRPLNGSGSHSKSLSQAQNKQHSSSSRSSIRGGSRSGPSSPVMQHRIVARKSVSKLDTEVKRSSGFSNTRDELLMSLLASEAVVDSREFTVLSSEEIEDLKKEQQVLNARLGATKKKLGLETKIRDAAISLSKVNGSHKQISKKTEEQLEAANRRVDAAQKELWSVSERANEVHRRLMEHRASVLSYSVRNMEKKMAPVASSYDSGYDSNRSTMISPNTSVTGASIASSKPRFDGAHFFAGHADAIVPKKLLSAEGAATEILSLEAKLRATAETLSAASQQQAELTRELSLVRLEKQKAETMMSLELQTAEETILALEKELPRLEGLDAEVQELLQEKEEWEEERAELEERSRQVEILQARIADLETRRGEAAGAEKLLAEAKEESQRQLEQRDHEVQELRQQWEMERAEWAKEREEWQQNKGDDLQRLREEMEMRGEDEAALQKATYELDEGVGALQRLIREHDIVLFTRETSLKALLDAVGSHLGTVHSKLEGYKQVEAEWSATKRKLEGDIKAGLDMQESMAKELEDAKRQRDFAKRETRSLQGSARSSPIVQHKPILPEFSLGADTDVNKIIAILQPIWAVLPSPDARAAKFGTGSRAYRTGSPASSSSGQTGSLSDLDVRTLKGLYNGSRDGGPNSPRTPTSMQGGFSIEAFAQRVQALVADDKALIERLIRFAQAHDLLKKNAERAQKLAQDGNAAMETYQKQVRILEERNSVSNTKISALQEELQLLHDTIERLTAEKHEIESLAAEQAETCRQLTESNNTLSAQTLTLAQEAASAPEMVKKQLEAQITELKKQLEKAEAEIEDMKVSQQSQRAALFEEMNSMHEENTNLRAQLRAAKK